MISNVTKGSIGNLIEWYGWDAYAAFSVYFAATFFPKGDVTAQLLNTAAIFGGTTGYIALALKNAGQESVFFYYVAGCVLISLLVYMSMRETSRNSPLDATAAGRVAARSSG